MRLVAIWLVLLFSTMSSFAHEYYLEPERYSVALGEVVGIAHKNGMRFKGSAYPWVTNWNIRSEAWQNGSGVPLKGQDGDRPALTIKSSQPGIVSVIHQSNVSTLTFKEWDKFVSYLADEGMEPIEQAHLQRNLPKTDFVEAYSRFAKTLVNVGSEPSGQDAVTGLKIELVALKNPGTLKRGEPLPVRVLYDGEPLKGVMVKVFAGVDTEVAARIRTDENGEANVPDLGEGAYLLNAVNMVEPVTEEAKAKKAAWESFWASLTLARP